MCVERLSSENSTGKLSGMELFRKDKGKQKIPVAIFKEMVFSSIVNAQLCYWKRHTEMIIVKLKWINCGVFFYQNSALFSFCILRYIGFNWISCTRFSDIYQKQVHFKLHHEAGMINYNKPQNRNEMRAFRQRP